MRFKQVRDTLSQYFIEKILPKSGSNHVFAIAISVLVGVLAAYGAILFRYLIQVTHLSFFSTSEYSIQLLENLEWWYRLLLPTVGGLLVGIIVTRIAPEVKGSGIPEVMESVALKGGIIRLRVLLTKALAAALTIGSGGSAGREGPIVHIGSAIGSAIGQFIGVSAKHIRTFVACGAAAGIAATFNAPIAGALFALEVIIGEMRVVSMPPVIISSVIATVISRHYLGDFPAFRVPAYQMLNPAELLLYAVLGVLAGIIASIFISSFIKTSLLFDKFKLPPFIKPALGGLCVGIIALYTPHVFGVGYETINSALWASIDLKILIVIIFAKLFATSLSLGSGGSGGIFAPSLFLGATLGAAWGTLANQFFPDWTAASGAYALVGMGAMVAGVTHAPISAILIIFELTNNYLIIPPLMVACIIALVISNHFCRKSIYRAKLESRGIKLYDKREVNLLRSIKVSEVMDSDPVLLISNTPFSQLLTALLSGKTHYAIVVNDKNKYIGTIELNDIREVLQEYEDLANIVIAQDIANTSMPFILQSDNLDLAMHLFGKTDKDEIAVCDNRKSKKVIAVLTKKAVINAYNLRIFQEDLTGGFGSIMDAAAEGSTIEVMDGMHLTKIEIPAAWRGKTIRQLDLRNKHGIEILLIHREKAAKNKNERPGLFPSADLKLKAGDKMLVICKKDKLNKLRSL